MQLASVLAHASSPMASSLSAGAPPGASAAVASATDAAVSPLASATDAAVSPLASATDAAVSPLASATDAVVSPVAVSTLLSVPLLVACALVLTPLFVKLFDKNAGWPIAAFFLAAAFQLSRMAGPFSTAPPPLLLRALVGRAQHHLRSETRPAFLGFRHVGAAGGLGGVHLFGGVSPSRRSHYELLSAHDGLHALGVVAGVG